MLEELLAWAKGIKNVKGGPRAYWWHLRQMLHILFRPVKDDEKGEAEIAVFFGALALLILGMFALVIVGEWQSHNMEHADSKHASAPLVRSAVQSSGPDKCEVWYAPIRGTALILVSMGDNRWGGVIWRVADSNNRPICEDSYECSAFARDRSYWSRVIMRDGYVPIAAYPNIFEALANHVFGVIGW